MHSAYIKIDFKKQSLEYHSGGHSGYAIAGQDIVCASASILAMTLADYLSSANEAEWVEKDRMTINLDSEHSEISCDVDDYDVFGELVRTFILIARGYELLAEHYPQYVEFKFKITA